MQIESTCLLILLTLISTVKQVSGLSCVQCNREFAWYSPEENERLIYRCQHGHIAPTPCANTSHTHCIVHYYKRDGAVVVTERTCGTEKDIVDCSIYRHTPQNRARMRRHFIGGSHTDTPLSRGSGFFGFGFGGSGFQDSEKPTNMRLGGNGNPRRRETGPVLVEICVGGCTEDGCLSDAMSLRRVSTFLLFAVTLIVLHLVNCQ